MSPGSVRGNAPQLPAPPRYSAIRQQGKAQGCADHHMRVTRTVPGAWVTGAATRFHYRVVGPADASRVPVVLVHGLGVSSAYFARLQPLLAVERRVYAVDLPGFGRTRPRPRHTLKGGDLAASLHEWMTALGLTRVHLIGHSLGGPVTVEFAHRYPECVAGLVLISPTIGTRGPRTPHLWCLLQDFLREPPSLFPVLMPDYVRAGIRRIIATDVVMDDEDTVGILATVHAPVLIIRGERDPIVSRENIHTLRDAAPLVRYHEIAGAPHVVQWREAPQVAAYIITFLAETNARHG